MPVRGRGGTDETRPPIQDPSAVHICNRPERPNGLRSILLGHENQTAIYSGVQCYTALSSSTPLPPHKPGSKEWEKSLFRASASLAGNVQPCKTFHHHYPRFIRTAWRHSCPIPQVLARSQDIFRRNLERRRKKSDASWTATPPLLTTPVLASTSTTPASTETRPRTNPTNRNRRRHTADHSPGASTTVNPKRQTDHNPRRASSSGPTPRADGLTKRVLHDDGDDDSDKVGEITRRPGQNPKVVKGRVGDADLADIVSIDGWKASEGTTGSGAGALGLGVGESGDWERRVGGVTAAAKRVAARRRREKEEEEARTKVTKISYARGY